LRRQEVRSRCRFHWLQVFLSSRILFIIMDL